MVSLPTGRWCTVRPKNRPAVKVADPSRRDRMRVRLAEREHLVQHGATPHRFAPSRPFRAKPVAPDPFVPTEGALDAGPVSPTGEAERRP